MLLGFSDHVAKRLDTGTLRCALVHGRRGLLARESVVQSSLLVATEIAEVQGKDINVILNLCTAIREDWLRDLFPEDFRQMDGAVYDEIQRRVFREHRSMFRNMVLNSERSEAGPESPLQSEAASLLASEVLKGNLVLKNWDESVQQWIVRVNRLREWMPELALPAIPGEDREHLIQQVCSGAVSYKEIKDKPVWPVVKSWLYFRNSRNGSTNTLRSGSNFPSGNTPASQLPRRRGRGCPIPPMVRRPSPHGSKICTASPMDSGWQTDACPFGSRCWRRINVPSK